jgi:hypothetical protein
VGKKKKDEPKPEAPADVTPPELKQPGLTGPTVDGTPRVGGGPPPRDPRGRRGKGVPQTVTPPPEHPAYSVSPGSINDAGNEILAESSTAVGAYDALKAAVAATKSWIFWAPNDNPTVAVYDSPNETQKNEPPRAPDDYAPAKDPHPEITAQMGAAEDNLLMEIGDSITLVGQFADQLNNAAQFYTRADKASALPELTGGINTGQDPKPAK